MDHVAVTTYESSLHTGRGEVSRSPRVFCFFDTLNEDRARTYPDHLGVTRANILDRYAICGATRQPASLSLAGPRGRRCDWQAERSFGVQRYVLILANVADNGF